MRLADSFHLCKRLFATIERQVVDAVNRNNEIKRGIGIGQSFGGTDVNKRASFAVGVVLRVGGNVYSSHCGSG